MAQKPSTALQRAWQQGVPPPRRPMCRPACIGGAQHGILTEWTRPGTALQRLPSVPARAGTFPKQPGCARPCPSLPCHRKGQRERERERERVGIPSCRRSECTPASGCVPERSRFEASGFLLSSLGFRAATSKSSVTILTLTQFVSFRTSCVHCKVSGLVQFTCPPTSRHICTEMPDGGPGSGKSENGSQQESGQAWSLKHVAMWQMMSAWSVAWDLAQGKLDGSPLRPSSQRDA